MRSFALTAAIVAAIFFLGCNSGAEEASSGDSTTGSEQSEALSAQRVVAVAPRGGDASGACAVETVYFAFDADTLDTRSRDAIEAAVACLRANRQQARLHITGATDPEGTEEYNLALGDRRATAVRNYLANLGVDRERITTSSVGEEMATGEDEEGWARDRHAATRTTD